MAGTDVQGAGQALLLFQYGVISAVKEVFQCATHIAQVFGGAEQNGITGHHVFRACIQRCLYRDRDVFDILMPGATGGGLAEFLRIR